MTKGRAAKGRSKARTAGKSAAAETPVGGGRRVRRAFCSATDRNVPVLLETDVPFGRRPSPRDGRKLVCLDYKVRCTGHLCPLFSVDESGEMSGPADLPLPPPAGRKGAKEPSA